MRTIHTETIAYKFHELAEAEQQKAIEGLYDINVNYDWWDFTYEDARNIGLEITGFDIDRGAYCEGKFIESAPECAEKILKEHGETCETHTTAKEFLTDRDEIVNTAPRDENGDFENEWELDRQLDIREAEFLKSLLEDYRIILQKEFDYLTSEAAILETIEANDYEFTKEGRII